MRRGPVLMVAFLLAAGASAADGSWPALGLAVPLVPLNRDPCDAFRTDACPAKSDANAGADAASELAALSHNLQVLLVALSAPEDADGDGRPDRAAGVDELDPDDPYRTESGQCSWLQPVFCHRVQAALPEPDSTAGLALALATLAGLRRWCGGARGRAQAIGSE